MRKQVIKALQILDDLLSKGSLDPSDKKALLQVKRILIDLQDSMVAAKSRVRDIAYTMSELARLLGLEVKIGSPRFMLANDDILKMISSSMMADLEVEGEQTIVKKLVAHA